MLAHKEKIGTLDREVYFVQAIIEQGDSNEDKITGWELIENYPIRTARKVERSGNTIVVSDSVSWDRQTEWIIRYDDGLESRNIGNIQHLRLVYETQMFQIVNISETGETRKRYMSVITQLLDNEYFT